jgi:hypothetical protein
MPYQEHPSFEPPRDEDAEIRRFMDFTKLVDLLNRKALFFRRADRFGDGFEGYYAKGNKKWNPIVYEGKLSLEVVKNLGKQLQEDLLVQRRYDYESHGLRQLY